MPVGEKSERPVRDGSLYITGVKDRGRPADFHRIACWLVVPSFCFRRKLRPGLFAFVGQSCARPLEGLQSVPLFTGEHADVVRLLGSAHPISLESAAVVSVISWFVRCLLSRQGLV
jgi:hypothetical protein